MSNLMLSMSNLAQAQALADKLRVGKLSHRDLEDSSQEVKDEFMILIRKGLPKATASGSLPALRATIGERLKLALAVANV